MFEAERRTDESWDRFVGRGGVVVALGRCGANVDLGRFVAVIDADVRVGGVDGFAAIAGADGDAVRAGIFADVVFTDLTGAAGAGEEGGCCKYAYREGAQHREDSVRGITTRRRRGAPPPCISL